MAQIRRRIKTGKPESAFDLALEQELLSFSTELAGILNKGLKFSDNFAVEPQAHIVNSAEALAELTTKFNTLLAELEAIGILKTS